MSWHRYDPKLGSRERWLNAITVYVASHYQQCAQHCRERLVGSLDASGAGPDAAATMESGGIRTGIIDAVNELDPELRYVLAAHDLNEIPVAQIADDVGLPVSTLYKRRAKAIRALRNIFRRQGASVIPTQKAGQQ